MQPAYKKALLFALVIIIVSVGVRLARDQGHLRLTVFEEIGPIGSADIYASFLVYINGTVYDFSSPEYHYGHPVVTLDVTGRHFHINATKVTVTYLLQTVGMGLEAECLTTPTMEQYCTSDDKNLRVYVNRELLPQSSYKSYVIGSGDKILVDYSEDLEIELMVRTNNIPDLPPNFY